LGRGLDTEVKQHQNRYPAAPGIQRRHQHKEFHLMRSFIVALAAVLAAFAIISATPAMAQSGLLTKAIELPPIILSAGKPLAEKPYELESGKHYKIMIKADGSQELAIEGPTFFRNVWVNEIVINDIEVRAIGVDSIEFDDEGEARLTFVTIRPGIFELKIPNSRGDSQKAIFKVKG
jgi:hypothetical protein